jgi:transcriptional regulator with XRE-family HTH domain
MRYFTIPERLYTFVDMSTSTERPVHIGRKIERIRILRGMKQETLATTLGVSQQAVSKMEASEQVDEDRLSKVAEALNVPVEAIKNFNEDAAVSFIANTFTDEASAYNVNYKCSFNPIDKIVELYERMLKLEQEKNVLLESVIKKGVL